MDFNAFINALTDVIADKVAERLKSGGSDWPNLETKLIPNEPKESLVEVPEVEREEREPVRVTVADHDGDARRVSLAREDVRTLRKKFATVEGVEPSTYSTWKKGDLVDKIVAFEQLVGHTLDEEIEKMSDIPDDTDISEPEVETDNEPVELTRESMLELDLPKLREIAADQGVKADLAGLDVEAVVALIYGDEVPQDDEEESDFYTKEEILEMSLAELKKLADDLVEQGAELDYNRGTDREVLANRIIDLVF